MIGRFGRRRSAYREGVRIYGELYGVGVAVDAVVVTPEDVERFGDSHPLVIKPALREGRVVYEAD